MYFFLLFLEFSFWYCNSVCIHISTTAMLDAMYVNTALGDQEQLVNILVVQVPCTCHQRLGASQSHQLASNTRGGMGNILITRNSELAELIANSLQNKLPGTW